MVSRWEMNECKADGTRQEVDSRAEVVHSEMSDW